MQRHARPGMTGMMGLRRRENIFHWRFSKLWRSSVVFLFLHWLLCLDCKIVSDVTVDLLKRKENALEYLLYRLWLFFSSFSSSTPFFLLLQMWHFMSFFLAAEAPYGSSISNPYWTTEVEHNNRSSKAAFTSDSCESILAFLDLRLNIWRTFIYCIWWSVWHLVSWHISSQALLFSSHSLTPIAYDLLYQLFVWFYISDTYVSVLSMTFSLFFDIASLSVSILRPLVKVTVQKHCDSFLQLFTKGFTEWSSCYSLHMQLLDSVKWLRVESM